LEIRPATARDFPQVVELFGALHAYNATFDPQFELADDWATYLAETFERSHRAPEALWALAWDGDQAVGLVVAETHLDPPLFRRRRWLELSALYVRPTHRRHGVARELVEHLLAWARERDFPSVALYVSAGNDAARAFYARNDFVPIQEIWRRTIAPGS
jgi:GNAT superfamily N-acetyltransferase